MAGASPFPPSTSPTDHPSATSVEDIPPAVLVDLLTSAQHAADPSRRDYGERYRFVRVLGEGGQGVVVCARDLLLEREVAIKALKGPFDKMRERILEREARLCGILEHPNILPTYDLCRDEAGGPLLVMKKIEGVSLEDLLKDCHNGGGQEISRRRLLNIFLQVCHAVEYAHSRGVYHLDLKPQNVKVGAFGEVYVIDWGFAVRENESEEIPYLAGTPVYIAPERLRGCRPDARCDVYSLGVILYRLLTNRLPRDVERLSLREYSERLAELPVIPLRQRDRSLPPDLEAIVMKAMADRPEERYPTARALAEDIDRYLDLLPVAAYGEGLLGRLWKFMRRHKRMTVAAVIVAMALAAAGVALWRNARLAHEKEAAEIARRRSEADLARQRSAILRRARARIPLEKAAEMTERLRDSLERESAAPRRREILAPALALFDEAIAKCPDYAEAYYERGKARYLARDFHGALDDFQRATALDRSCIMAHYYAGKIYADAFRDHERARAEFGAMQEMDEEKANEYAELGQAYIDLAEERYAEALQRCERIERLNPGIADVWYIRGLAHQKSEKDRDLTAALAAYDRYLALRSDNPSAYLNRGAIRHERGDSEGAIADFTAALAVKPDYVFALLDRGYLLYRQGRVAEGLADIERAIAVKPNFSRAYLDRASIYEFLREWEKAERDLETARRLDPRNANAWYRSGVFYFLRGNLAEAEAVLDRAIQLSGPGETATRYHRRGIVRLARGRYADAVRDFEESLSRRSEGRIYSALMRWLALQLAGEPIDRAVFAQQLHAPAEKPWLAAVGAYYLGEAKAEEALALADTPEAKCETHFYLGAYALGVGDKNDAAEHFRAALNTGAHLYMEYGLAKILMLRLSSARADGGEGESGAPETKGESNG